MYSCKLSGDHKHTKDFQKLFPQLISLKAYLSAPKFSKRMVKSGLNMDVQKVVSGQSRTDVVNMSTPPHMKLNFGIRALKSTLKPNLRLIKLKLGKLQFSSVTTHKHAERFVSLKIISHVALVLYLIILLSLFQALVFDDYSNFF